MRGEAASAESRLVRVASPLSMTLRVIAVIAFVVMCIILGNPWILTSQLW